MDGGTIGTRPSLHRGRTFALATIFAFVLAVLPFADHLVGRHDAFLPAVLAVVAAANLLTATLLFHRYSITGRVSIGGTAIAYLFAGLAAGAYGLTFPGVIFAHPLFDANDSTAPWLWRMWHTGFPGLLAIAFGAEHLTRSRTITYRARRRAIFIGSGAAVLLAIAGSAGVFLAADHLPTIINANRFTSMWRTGGWVVLSMNVLAFVVTLRAAQHHGDVTSHATVVAAWACLADTILNFVAVSRYTTGWYASRSLSVATATIILGAVIVELSRLYRKSEQDKVALANQADELINEKRRIEYRERAVRRIIENAADAYVETDRDGIIQTWSPRASELFGWSAQEAVGQDGVSLMFLPHLHDDVRRRITAFAASSDNHESRLSESEVVGKDGERFPVEASAWIDGIDGEHQTLHFFIRDITTRRRTEETLQQALADERALVLRLQELDRAKSDFVSSISHELRSPLTSTLGYLELLADGDAGTLEPEQSRMVEIADRNAKRLLGLIEDLLTLSRIESGSFSVRFKPLGISEVIAQSVQRLLPAAAERSIAMNIDIADDLGVCAGDQEQILRALGNIMNNAVKFTPPGGQVGVSARRVADNVMIIVNDTGIGIPPEEQPQLFNRFFRASIAVEKQHQGAGLGLTIAKAIVEHHGGNIEVRSVLSSGTTVTMTLPALPLPVVSVVLPN